MKKTFTVVRFNEPDSQGDVILPSAIKNLDKMPVMTQNFDISLPVGIVESMEVQGEELKISADMEDQYANLTPAIEYSIINSEVKDGVRYIKEIKLHSISLCTTQNVDPTIRSINEQ